MSSLWRERNGGMQALASPSLWPCCEHLQGTKRYWRARANNSVFALYSPWRPTLRWARALSNFLHSSSPSPLSAVGESTYPLNKPFSGDDEEDDEAAEEYDEAAEEYKAIYNDDEVLTRASEEEDDDDEEEELEGEDDFDVKEDEEVSGFVSKSPLSRFGEHKWQRVEKLRSRAREFGADIIDLEDIISIYDFPIDKFQCLAIQAFLRGSSVVVSAPTSSGKTLIAEAAATATVTKGRRLLYTTPLKALSNQKFREFRETFGESSVGLLTGDSVINKDSQILIMTTEILRNMLYQSVGMIAEGSRLFQVDVIVLDEVHYLSDISRGTVWEEIVIYCPKEVQLICLSATVANPEELAGWIGQIHGPTELITSTKRPVPLNWHFSLKNSLLPLLDEKGTKMNKKLSLAHLQRYALGAMSYREEGLGRRKARKGERERSYGTIPTDFGESSLSENDINIIRRSQVPQVRDTLRHLRARDMLPAIWFIFSRKGCDAAVQYLEECMLLDDCEMDEVGLALKKFRTQYPDAIREVAVRGLMRGVAAHHAGCLPLWKSFIEELFQRGLIKVVFATETLAAGINMPARTAVIASLSKKIDTGRILLSSNELLQMAGRAGRRGIDKQGHVVLIQTPFEGVEECCKLLFAGPEPLVSQFTASYGMVLNLLAGANVTRGSKEADVLKVFRAGRTLEEARQLVEQSFGNYVGSNVMVAAKEELSRIEGEIEMLTVEVSDEAVDRKSREKLLGSSYNEIIKLQEELRAQKRLRTQLRKRMELERVQALKPLLAELESGQLPFICLQYKDNDAVHHLIPAVYLGKIDSVSSTKYLISGDGVLDIADAELDLSDDDDFQGTNVVEPSHYVALGSDNSSYMFTENWIKAIYTAGLPDNPLSQGDASPREIMRGLLEKEGLQWEKLAKSAFGSLWSMEGSLETWSWSLNVPVLSSLSEDDEVLKLSEVYHEAVESYKDQRTKVSKLRKQISRTKGFAEFKKIMDTANLTKEKIKRLKARSIRLVNRIEQIEPSGWKEFLQVSNVIHEARAMDINTQLLFPLGETASAIRGENELWLAMVLRNKIFLDLRPAQLAAVCGSLVSEGIKVRYWKSHSHIYEPSSIVTGTIDYLEEQRRSLLRIQAKHGVEIPCELDDQFSGMVEAWASGLTWREIMMDCAMDDGDLARLLRRTIDILSQVANLLYSDQQIWVI
ncbi:DExH-box ATP-dependent RNA helicase DExH15 chloroplastic isoform X2 [Amborella trichopoda]|uniref:DExH-box ATP-dependent RNA helicase DExH15 chloroplastic isoform X2 n=1 Tax=Amborella trichopoda TaxID=13333 RepID=UPI0009C1A072|nr:DExH-box ATP-dependent RNA helicase DExH15 chloroplastic isoform X2 [Amborella trichopoda]|eukprot:XP_020520261.1 DExH-box ATP-dependent RNA helicase DExH15 chloroplastic isoform X2 [Amborella trichopoda]